MPGHESAGKENEVRPQGSLSARREQSARSLVKVVRQELGIPDDYSFAPSRKTTSDDEDVGEIASTKKQKLMDSAMDAMRGQVDVSGQRGETPGVH